MPTEKLSIELENIDKAQIQKEVGAGLNTVKVASNTVKITKVNPNAVSVRNSNSALDYRHPDELKFAGAANQNASSKLYPREILAQSQKPAYGHS